MKTQFEKMDKFSKKEDLPKGKAFVERVRRKPRWLYAGHGKRKNFNVKATEGLRKMTMGGGKIHWINASEFKFSLIKEFQWMMKERDEVVKWQRHTVEKIFFFLIRKERS